MKLFKLRPSFSDASLLTTLAVMFIVASLFLFSASRQALDPNTGKNWWSVNFTNPTSFTDFSFTIANHTPTADFSYPLSSSPSYTTPNVALSNNKNTASPEAISADTRLAIPSGVTQTTTLNTPPTTDTASTTVRLIIRHGDEVREIYK